MAQPIIDRISRILSGKVQDAVDHMEQSGSDTVMRESIREVDRLIDQLQAQHDAAVTRRLQAVRQQKLLQEKARDLQEKAKFALGEGREDLAEAALTRQVDFEVQAKGLDKVQQLASEEEARFEENITALRTRKSQMEDALSGYMAAKRDAMTGGDGSTQLERNLEKRVGHAEQAFDRAMTGTDGIGFTRSDADTINRVAELDTMQRKTEIAQRLAALKQVTK